MDLGPSFCQYDIAGPIICKSLMAFYAVDEDDLIDAIDAEPNKIYWCLDCFMPVKARKGKRIFAHFYHLQSAPACKLYSKSEDHLVAQLELKRSFPKGVIDIEKPFIKIGRVADACWEKEKIIFEIQCSSITEKEVEKRMSDYSSVGFDVVWLLDDKKYNQRICRPAEEYFRQHCSYFLSTKQMQVYDQFEIFKEGRRVKKSRPLPIDLRKILYAPKRDFCKEHYPQQIIQLKLKRHFENDRLQRALRYPLAMQVERDLELQFQSKPSSTAAFFRKHILCPYKRLLEEILKER